MDEFWTSVVVPVLLALVTGGGVGLLTYRATIRKIDADSQKTIADAENTEAQSQNIVLGGAVSVVEMLRGELEHERQVRREMVDNLRKEMEVERQARRRDADECKAAIERIGQSKDSEIGLLQTEVVVLRNQVISLKGENTKLRRRVSELEKNGHGEPKEAFTDPPPSDDAPEDWH